MDNPRDKVLRLKRANPARPFDSKQGRLSPGQYLTPEGKFPVLHYGSTPRFDPQTWDFKIWGQVSILTLRLRSGERSEAEWSRTLCVRFAEQVASQASFDCASLRSGRLLRFVRPQTEMHPRYTHS